MRSFPFILFLLVAALPCVESGALRAARLSGVTEIETPVGFALKDEADLVRLEAFPARTVESVDSPGPPLDRPQWYRIALSDDAETVRQGMVLRIFAAPHERIEAHLVSDGRVVESVTAGYRVPVEQRRHHATNLVLPLQEWRGRHAAVFLRVETRLRYPLRPELLGGDQLRRETDTGHMLTFTYLGGVMVLLFFQAALFIHFREKAARDYIFVSFGLLAISLAHSGHFDLVAGGVFDCFWLGDWRYEIRLLNCVLSLRAFSTYFQLNDHLPRLNRGLQGSLLAIVGLLAVCPFLPHETVAPLVSAAQLYAVGAAAAVLFMAFRRKLIGAGIMAAGWSGILFVTGYLNLVRLGMMPGVLDTPFLPIAAVLWELLMSTVGLGYKFKRLSEIRHERELSSLEAAGLERMVRVLCHDVSTPLAAIGMTTELIEMNQQAGRPVDVAVNNRRVREAFLAIKEIVDAARSVELAKLHGRSLARDPVDLCAAFSDAERMMRDKLARKRITLRRIAWPEQAVVLAEPRLLRLSVITNALSNAIKFSPAGAVIEVEIRSDGGEVTLRIRDHGVGIPPEMREAFARSGRITSRVGTMSEEGTGFGLMLMRDFAVAMGGRFRLESRTTEESPSGHGTTVEITLQASGAA